MLTLNYLFELNNPDFKIHKYDYNNLVYNYKIQLKQIKDLPQPTNKELKSSEYYIITNNNKHFAGILVLDVNPPDNYNILGGLNRLKQMGHDIEIIFFYVYEEYRHIGLGQKLLSYVINKYNNKYIGLGTGLQSSLSAKNVYSLYGFKPVITDHNFQWWLRKPKK